MSLMRAARSGAGVVQLASPAALTSTAAMTHACTMFATTIAMPPQPAAASTSATHVYASSPATSAIPDARNFISRVSTRSGIAASRRM